MSSLIKKLFVKETAVESAGILLFFLIIEKVIQTFRGIIFARLLGPTEYGIFNLAFFFLPLGIALAQFGIPSCYSRYIPQYEKKNMLANFLKRNFSLTIGTGVLITILSLLFSKQVSSLVYNSTEYRQIIVLCSLTIIPYVLYENLLYSFYGMRVFKVGALLKFGQFLFFTLLSVTLVFFYPEAIFAISANLVALIFISSFFGLKLWKYIQRHASQDLKIQEDNYYSKIIKYSIWFFITPVVFNVFSYVDRLMLNRFLGLQNVGIYSVMLNVTSLLFMFGMITGNVLMPNLSNVWERGDKDKAMFILNFAMKIVTLFAVGCAMVLVIFKQQVISILYGSRYLDGLPVVDILLIFWVFNVTFWIAGAYSRLIEKTYITLIISVPGLILNIGLNYILIPEYGMRGAAIATTIAYMFMLVGLLLLNKMEKMKINLKTVFVCITPAVLLFNNATLVLCILVLCAFTVKTNLIITQEERAFLVQEMRNVYQRVLHLIRR